MVSKRVCMVFQPTGVEGCVWTDSEEDGCAFLCVFRCLPTTDPTIHFSATDAQDSAVSRLRRTDDSLLLLVDLMMPDEGDEGV
jgi:hypothetical protein